MPREETPIEVHFAEALISQQQARSLASELAKVPSDEIEVTLNWLKTGPITLNTGDNASALSKASNGRIGRDKALNIATIYFRLESLRRALQWTPEEFVHWFVQDGEGDETQGTKTIDKGHFPLLTKLLTPSPLVELIYKAQRIYEGSLPSYVDSHTTVDFRPVFSQDMAIEHGLITTVLELIVRKPEETSEQQKIAIQVDWQDMLQLEEVLARAKQKIKVLKNSIEGEKGIKLFNPTNTLEQENK